MKRLTLLFILGAFLLSGGSALAAHGHYLSGVEGIKAATLPPPGFYWRLYNVYYSANTMKDKHGKETGNFHADIYALVNRFIYMTDFEILGAQYGMDVVIPLTNTNLYMSHAFNDSNFGVGDVLVEPLILAWHGARWDAMTAFGVYMPTGEYSRNNMASPGKGFWSFLFTGGGTVYFDEAKTWSASILARYETHTQQEETRIQPGDDFHFEWGVGKAITDSVEVGLAGYCQWQLKRDSGSWASDGMERGYAVGPEIGFTIAPWALTVSVRSLWEFEAKSASQGNITSLILTKAF